MSKFQILRKTAQYLQVPDLSTTACGGGDGEVKCGDSRIDKFCATFKFAHYAAKKCRAAYDRPAYIF